MGRDVLPLLTALPFYRQKNTVLLNTMPGSREDGKGRFTAAYRLTVLPAKKYRAFKYNAGKSGKREETFFPNLTALPFYRQKNVCYKCNAGKPGRSRFETGVYELQNQKYHKPLKQSVKNLIAFLFIA